MAVAAPAFGTRQQHDDLTLRDAFRERMKARKAERLGQRITFMEWALRVPEPKAGILNFDAFPMQRELYDEGYDDREMVVVKSTQVGVSAWGVRWAIYHTDLRGMTGLYVFPTLSDVYDFSDARIKTVIDASRYLRARVLPDDPDNKGLKKIGLGFIYFRGSESKRKLDSVDADHLVLDEYDTLAQDNIPDAERRLSGPLSKGLIRRLGVPSIPGWGIAKAYCLAPDARVLLRDLRWKPAGDLAVGDELVGFDEENVSARGRRFRPSTVQTVGRERLRAFRVSMEDGSVVTASAEHRWLVLSGSNLRWKATKRIAPGDRICSVGMWEVEQSREAGWLAGIFDGEGYVHAGEERASGGVVRHLGFSQREGAVLAAARDLMARRGFVWGESDTGSGCRGVTIQGGVPEKLRLLGQIRPERLVVQAHKVWDGVNVGSTRKIAVASIEDLGEQEVVTLGTSTKTLIVEGMLSHNSESDQRRWHVKCGACGDYQPITFWDNVDQRRAIVVCRRCTKPLDVRSGEWVAAYPDRSVRGYHVTRLIAPTANISKIVEQSKKRDPVEKRVFFNKDLGEAYAPAEGRLSREAIVAAQRGYAQVPGYVGPGPVTMGIDVASTRALNVRISKLDPEKGTKVALLLKEVENFNELERLMDRYDVNMAVVDHLPDGRLARAFAEKFAGRVFVCAYDTVKTPTSPQVIKVDEEMRFVTVRRTEAMDATAEMIRAQHNLLPLDLPEGYVDAMQAPNRVVTKDDLGRKVVRYQSLGNDDWFHAEVYDLVAEQCWWFRQARDEQDRDAMTPLEDMLEFERSHLADPAIDEDYSPGGVYEQEGYYEGGSSGY